MKFKSFALSTTIAIASLQTVEADTKPLKALLLIGGCCHDYEVQKDLLEKGIEQRANVEVDVIYGDNGTTKPNLPIYGNADYANGYDVVIHDECAADISDDSVVKAILAPHVKGIPGVNLHCAMHSYRIGDFSKPVEEKGTATSQWFEYLGLQSTGHGPQKPIEMSLVVKDHPITKNFENTTSGDEELYNNLKIFDTAVPLVKGVQNGQEAVVVWTNDYRGTRVFNTSIGHNNSTVSDGWYLDLVTRGLLWATGKIDPNGEIAEGYAKPK